MKCIAIGICEDKNDLDTVCRSVSCSKCGNMSTIFHSDVKEWSSDTGKNMWRVRVTYVCCECKNLDIYRISGEVLNPPFV